MPRPTKDQIQKLAALDDNARADLASLIDDIEERETQIASLKKRGEDSDKIVAKNSQLENLSKKQADEIALLNGRFSALEISSKPGTTAVELSMFRPFLDLFNDETENQNPPGTS